MSESKEKVTNSSSNVVGSKMEQLDSNLEKVSKRHKIAYKKNMENVDFLLKELRKCKAELTLLQMQQEESTETTSESTIQNNNQNNNQNQSINNSQTSTSQSDLKNNESSLFSSSNKKEEHVSENKKDEDNSNMNTNSNSNEKSKQEAENLQTIGVLQKLEKSIKDSNIQKKVTDEHKEYHALLSKYGKLIDKSFNNKIEEVVDKTKVGDKEKIGEAIIQHLLRLGLFDVSDSFFNEFYETINNSHNNSINNNGKQTLPSGESKPKRAKSETKNEENKSKEEKYESMKKPFKEMVAIVNSLKQKNVDSALQWASSHSEFLKSHNIPLEWNLHKLGFLSLLHSSDQALSYARKFFSQFISNHLEEIQKLTSYLLYTGKVEESPYGAIKMSEQWEELINLFISSSCSHMGLSFRSPLLTVVNAGALELPKQLKLATISKGKFQNQGLEFSLGNEYRFHSVFACPVSKEQTTLENAPFMSSCGHVISNNSLHKLSRNNSTFKCPYCPTENLLSKAIELHF